MKILERYLLLLFARNILFSSIGLTIVFLFQKLLTEIVDKEFTSGQVFYFNFLMIPQVFTQMSPPAVMLGVVMTLSGLSRSNELVAMYSIGLGLKRIVSMLLVLVGAFSFLLLGFQDRILPPVFKARTTYYWREMKKKNDFYLDFKQDKIWYRSQQMIYNLRLFEATSQTIQGMAIYEFDSEFQLKRVVEAESAAFAPGGGWILRKGTQTDFSADDPFPKSKAFAQRSVVIEETPKEFQEIEKEVDGLRIVELATYIKRMGAAGADTKATQVKLHSRWSLSFMPIVMGLLGVPFSLRGRREGGVAKDLGICGVMTFFYWLFYSIGLSLGSNGALPPWLAAWLPSFVFGALAVVLVTRVKQV